MSELKEYVVGVHKFEDLSSLYHDLENLGGSNFIPNRPVEVADRNSASRATHYFLTDEEAELLKNDFTDAKNNGTIDIISASTELVRTLLDDTKSENSETISIQLRLGSITGPIIATSTISEIYDINKKPVNFIIDWGTKFSGTFNELAPLFIKFNKN